MSRYLTRNEIERLSAFPESDSTRLLGSRFREWQEEQRTEMHQTFVAADARLLLPLTLDALRETMRQVRVQEITNFESRLSDLVHSFALCLRARPRIEPGARTLSEQIAAMEAEIEEIKQSPAEWRPQAAPTG